MKLLSVVVSPLKTKKWRANFDNGTHTDFGFKGMEDYTQHGDKDRRFNYVRRHLKDLKTNDPTRAGFLSMFILWGKSRSIEKNIQYYKQMFHL